MPKYLFQSSFTIQGVEGVRSEGGSGRRDAVASTIDSVGGQLECFYFGFGQHDSFVIADLPDDEAAAAIALTVNAAGGAAVQTTVLLTPEQIDEAAKRSVDYRAPGS